MRYVSVPDVALGEHLATYPGVFGVADSFQSGKDEIELAILPSAEALVQRLLDHDIDAEIVDRPTSLTILLS